MANNLTKVTKKRLVKVKVEKPLRKTTVKRAKAKRNAIEKKEQKVYNLCSICAGISSCTYPKEPGKPILFCEEFKEYPSLSGKIAAKTEPAGKVSKETKVFKGLCVNCENRETCVFPKPEGGVWHCEEYC